MAICTSRRSTLDAYRSSLRGQEPIPRFYSPSRSIPPGSRNARHELVAIDRKGLGWPRSQRPAQPFVFSNIETWKIIEVGLNWMEWNWVPHMSGLRVGLYVIYDSI